jgi:hypothetical protein
MVRHHFWRALVLVFGLIVLVAPSASAGPGVAGPNIKVSGASPFASCTADAGQTGTNFLNSEVEPSVAVSTVDRNGDGVPDRIGVYQQDRWDNGGARGIVASVFNQGAWHQVVIPGVSKCSGGTFDRATDPWVTIAPNGDAYVQTLTFQDFPTFSTSIIYVNKSTDGGLTWSAPVQLVRDDSLFQFNDKNSITADPNDSDFVYAVWDVLTGPPSDNGNPTAGENSVAFTGDTIFTRSSDGGVTWEPIRTILEPGTRNQTIGNQIVVRPASAGGELVNVFNLIHEAANAQKARGFNAAVQISNDHGSTWSGAILADKILSVPTVDPDTGLSVRTADFLLDAAVDPTNGNLYAAWEDARFSGGAYNDAALITSTDGGHTWSSTIAVPRALTGVVGRNRQSFLPQVHVSTDGRLAVSYYDFRHNDGSGVSETDYYVNQCAVPDSTQPDLCAGNWIETRVTAQSFDIREAPVTVRGFFLGDYVGLTDVPGAFATAFAVSSAGDPATTYYSTVPFSP